MAELCCSPDGLTTYNNQPELDNNKSMMYVFLTSKIVSHVMVFFCPLSHVTYIWNIITRHTKLNSVNIHLILDHSRDAYLSANACDTFPPCYKIWSWVAWDTLSPRVSLTITWSVQRVLLLAGDVNVKSATLLTWSAHDKVFYSQHIAQVDI